MILRAVSIAAVALALGRRDTDALLLEPRPAAKAVATRPGHGSDVAQVPAAPACTGTDRTKGRDRIATLLQGLRDRVRYWAIVNGNRAKGRRVLPLHEQERLAYLALRDASLFDEAWYLEQNPDVIAAGVDPLHHLIKHGIYEGRVPNRTLASEPSQDQEKDEATAAADVRARYQRAIDGLTQDNQFAPALDKGHLDRFSDAAILRGLARFEHFPLFKPSDYLALNAPLRAAPRLDPQRHAFTYGFSEGRCVFDRQTIANELGLRSRMALASTNDFEAPHTRRLSISILCNASGNLFLNDIARCLAHDLRGAGHHVVLLDDMSDIREMREHNIVVAPHEFFFVGSGQRWLSDDVLRRSVMYNTEQPQTIWFDRAVPFNLISRGVIDLSCQVASMYADCLPAIHCDPCGERLHGTPPDLTCPIIRVLPRAAQSPGSASSPTESRSIDVSFFGGMSEHRDRFFAKTARFFADYKTLFYCRRATSPLLKDEAIDLTAAARHVAFHSKIVLNIHRDEFGFFEWHRIVRLGIETGAVVVSEPCLPHPYLKPNVHYFEESGRHIQNLVEWLLKTPDGQAEYRKVKHGALSAIARRRLARDAGKRIANFLDSLEGACP